MKKIIAILITLLVAAPALAAETQLADFSFWRANAGWWRSDNTYFDQDLNYIIRSYNSVIHIELEGRTYRETEYKTYAPSKLALIYGAGKTTAEEGVETVTVSIGELVDEGGTVRLVESNPAMPGAELTETRILNNDTAMRVTSDPATRFDAYRMVITMPTPDKRYVANFGLVSGTKGPGSANAAPDAAMGDLRGFSLFRADRIAEADVQKWRDEFRVRNKVAAIVEAGPDGKPAVRRLDAE